ncbi:MAG: hypothetical protein NZ888_08300, partial [Candidatus Nitrosocaldus sp.]|nr:hypothetical protein [Candidatus Nitrosocaldus sp.]
MNISKKQMLMYAGAIAMVAVSASLIFSAIAGPKLQHATLAVERYDVNFVDKRCPLSKDEEKRLGFVTLDADDLSKVPKLKQAMVQIENEFEYRVNNWSDFWIKDSDGCYTLTDLGQRVYGYVGVVEPPVIGIKLTEDEYHTIKSLIYNAYRTQHTQEELNRLAELYKGFHPSDPSVNAMPTDLLE